MTTPISPRTLRGALVGIDPMNPLASVIVFQYNPDTLQRTLQPQMAGGGEGDDRSEAMRLKGPPAETIKVDIEIDATDALASADPTAQSMGIYPQLSALEMLVYPKTSLVIANTVLLALGHHRDHPALGPADDLRLGCQAGRAGQDRRVQHHRRGLRRRPEPHPGQGVAGAAGPLLHRPADHQPGLRALPRSSGRQGGDGDQDPPAASGDVIGGDVKLL